MLDFLLFVYIVYLQLTASNRRIVLYNIIMIEGDIFATSIASIYGMNVHVEKLAILTDQ
jgi:hypothetical protein